MVLQAVNARGNGTRVGGEPPSILVVVLEGARADHCGCYGYERDTTPFIDQLAAEGVRFTHAFTATPSVPGAHASLLTGLYASVHGVNEENPILHVAQTPLAAHLKAAGYRTAAFCPDPQVGPQSGFGGGFDRFSTSRAGGRLTGRAADYARRASDRVLGRGDAGARRTNAAVREWVTAEMGPFFAYVVYREPAESGRTPAPYDRMFAAPGDAESSDAAMRARYDGALRYSDLRLKELAEALQAAGRYDSCLLLVTATHGAILDAHEAPLADAVLHVPLLLRCPGRIPRGFVVDAFAQSTDVLPTVLRLAGAASTGALGPGRPLLDDDGPSPGPDAVIAETFRAPATAGIAPVTVRRKAVRTRREKFVWQSDEHNGLFDLVRDPLERHNLIAQDSARADRLRRRLFDWLAVHERWAESSGIAAAQGAAERAGERQGASE